MHRIGLVLMLLVLALPAQAADPWQGKSAAFFGFHWIDTSLEGELAGPRADEAARLAAADTAVADAFRSAGVSLVDLAPVKDEIDRIASPSDCYGCDARMAARLGADFAITGEVQKVSNLILSMNVIVRAADTGEQVRGLSVDIRGNTEESWAHGVRYILKHGIFTDQP